MKAGKLPIFSTFFRLCLLEISQTFARPESCPKAVIRASCFSPSFSPVSINPNEAYSDLAAAFSGS
jgi:hypothetical protein